MYLYMSVVFANFVLNKLFARCAVQFILPSSFEKLNAMLVAYASFPSHICLLYSNTIALKYVFVQTVIYENTKFSFRIHENSASKKYRGAYISFKFVENDITSVMALVDCIIAAATFLNSKNKMLKLLIQSEFLAFHVISQDKLSHANTHFDCDT